MVNEVPIVFFSYNIANPFKCHGGKQQCFLYSTQKKIEVRKIAK